MHWGYHKRQWSDKCQRFKNSWNESKTERNFLGKPELRQFIDLHSMYGWNVKKVSSRRRSSCSGKLVCDRKNVCPFHRVVSMRPLKAIPEKPLGPKKQKPARLEWSPVSRKWQWLNINRRRRIDWDRSMLVLSLTLPAIHQTSPRPCWAPTWMMKDIKNRTLFRESISNSLVLTRTGIFYSVSSPRATAENLTLELVSGSKWHTSVSRITEESTDAAIYREMQTNTTARYI